MYSLKKGKGSKLEKLTYHLWQDEHDGNYTSWQFASFSPESAKMPPKNSKPDKLPALRCYLGESSAYQYDSKVKKPLLKTWFHKLVSVNSGKGLSLQAVHFGINT